VHLRLLLGESLCSLGHEHGLFPVQVRLFLTRSFSKRLLLTAGSRRHPV